MIQDRHMLNLRDIRRSRGLSQEQLAAAVGCNQATIAKIERGTANPTLSMIEAIALALRVSPASLFEMKALQSRVLSAFDALPPDQQAAAVAVLESMATSKA